MGFTLTDILHALLLGLIEGVTEWLPVSSTGHLILVDAWIQPHLTDGFKEFYYVVIQLGAIMAVVVLYWQRLIPFSLQDGIQWKQNTLILWLKVLVACIPAGIYAFTLDSKLYDVFYNYWTVAIMLVVVGVLFLVIETKHKGMNAGGKTIADITFSTALIIGIAQMIAAILPGTSRSGATILCGLMLGLSRSAAADFSFILAIPAMFGASLLKLLKFGFVFSGTEILILVIGMVTAFLVSMLAIKFLQNYVRNHDFKVFGWYRIVLGGLVLVSFL
jgi:undecaprenyl-diphosphatase